MKDAVSPVTTREDKAARMRIDFLANHLDLIPDLAKLHFEEWSYLRPEESLEGRTQRLRDSCARTIPTVFIALSNDDELFGSAMLVRNDLLSYPQLTPWLAGVYVKDAYRGRGIAKALTERVIIQAKSQGFNELFLYSPDSESLYERLGWSVIERHLYNGTEVSVMVRSLLS
jgi:GNAT superfamily N-acetyltransferase